MNNIWWVIIFIIAVIAIVNKKDDEQKIIENPYQPGTGHYAGYEWAKDNNPGTCGGSSLSFIEGCEEYFNQIDRAEAEEEREKDRSYML